MNDPLSNLAVQPGNERRSYYYAAQPEFYTWNYFTAAGTTGRYQLFDNKTESIFLDGTLEEATFIKVKNLIIFGDSLVKLYLKPSKVILYNINYMLTKLEKCSLKGSIS